MLAAGEAVSLFVKKLPHGCTAEGLTDALGPCGVVENVKMLSNRRAFVDLSSGSPLLQECIAAASLQLAGLDCFVGVNNSLAGGAKQTDQRQLERSQQCPAASPTTLWCFQVCVLAVPGRV